MSKRKIRFAFVAVVLILVLVMLYSGFRILESTVLSPPQEQAASAPKKTIERNGIAYFPRQDITVILVMGIDDEGPVTDSGSYRNTGEVDMAALVILDQTNETYSILCLNRDTILEMPVLGLGGKQAGTYYGQLALSHTYGSGLEDSAENTRTAVSDLLYGITIDYYVAMNMDAIGILNDAVGGVTVNVTDDFSAVDPSISLGQVTLNREQAMTFVRSRKDVGSGLNLSRMARHEEYLNGLADALTGKLEESDTFVAEVYEQMSDYMVTDCSVNAVSGLMQRCTDYTLVENVTLAGENRLGEEYYEFYPDEQALDALVLRLFYAPKE
ncbi:MAG: LCP family protein [Oscillospiraceae bacterium]|nr:LCP family protein [Oscillospiraceae bacterium]